MTNGEKIQSMFPNMNFGTLAQDDVIVNRDYSNNDEPQVFIPKSVWNAEYKEPTTKNDLGVDCISRKAVLDKAKSYNTDGYDSYTPLVVDVEDIEDLPSVTPQEPKTGHWIYIGNSEVNGLKICKCSNCEKKTYGSHKFCPNCGADMER